MLALNDGRRSKGAVGCKQSKVTDRVVAALLDALVQSPVPLQLGREYVTERAKLYEKQGSLKHYFNESKHRVCRYVSLTDSHDCKWLY